MKEKQELQVVNNNEIAITPQTLLMKAIEKGVDVDQLGKFMELQERFEKKESEKKFNIAKLDWQANKPVLRKTKDVMYNNKKAYSFIPLPEIQQIIDPVLSKYGLSYNWRQTVDNDGKISIICVVKHVDGHFEETESKSDKDASGGKNSIQAIGSAISYLKRYTLKDALGLSEFDDDGNSVDKAPKEKPLISLEVFKRAIIAVNKGTATKETILSSYSLTEDQSNTIDTIINSKNKSDEKI